MFTIRNSAGLEIATVSIDPVSSATVAGAVLTALSAGDGATLEVSSTGSGWQVRTGADLYTVEPV